VKKNTFDLVIRSSDRQPTFLSLKLNQFSYFQAQITFYVDQLCSGENTRLPLLAEGKCGDDILGGTGSSNYFCIEDQASTETVNNEQNPYFLVFVTVINTILFKA
jgi:hypothetical protein